jgi:hypothetical protein
MYVRLKKGKGAKNHLVYLLSRSGDVLSLSEGYATHWNAKRAARRMFPDLPRVDENGTTF